jgi:hypothetical protein
MSDHANLRHVTSEQTVVMQQERQEDS